MLKKRILLVALLSGISVVAMDHIKEMSPGKEASRNEEETLVKICLTDSAQSDTPHEIEISVRLAKLIGALNNDLVEDPSTKNSIFPLLNMTLVQWQLIEPLLEHVYRITHDAFNAGRLRKEIIAEYNKLDAQSLIDLIHALDYADIPLLLDIACDEVKKSNHWRFNFEQINSLPGDMGNGIILDKILASCGPMRARELAVCRGHEYGVRSVCITKDGKIVSGSDDGTVRVWDVEGKELVVCRGHKDRVTSICVTKNNNIVSGSHDKTIRVWDMAGYQLAECRGHEGLVASVYVTQDGKIVSGSYDQTVRVWDMRGKELAVCRGHEDSVLSVCVTHDGKIVSGSSDKTIRVWGMQGNELVVCRGHEGLVKSVCVTKDGKIVSGSWDKTVRIWDMEGKELAVCRGHGAWVLSVCVTNDSRIVSGSRDKTICVWDMFGQELAVCRGHELWVGSVCTANDGKIVSGSDDQTVRVWDVGLLGRIVHMDEDQARTLWELLHNTSQNAWDCNLQVWKEIEKILREDTPVAQAKINKNNNE